MGNNKKMLSISSFKAALNGIKYFTATEKHANVHLISGILVIATAIILDFTYLEWAVVLLSIAAVISTEIINTSIEKLVDFVSPEHHQMAGLIKDLAAGAVLVSAVLSALIGLIIIVKHVS